MKTAEKWADDFKHYDKSCERTNHIRLFEDIQLDAIKEGMWRAAKMHELGDSVHSMEQSILTTSEQLTKEMI